jgi:hypothetical protein
MKKKPKVSEPFQKKSNHSMLLVDGANEKQNQHICVTVAGNTNCINEFMFEIVLVYTSQSPVHVLTFKCFIS